MQIQPGSLAKIAQLHPKFRQQATDFLTELQVGTNRIWCVVQGLRTFAEQEAIYNEGRTTKGPNVRNGHPLGDVVTKSPAGASYHNYGLAIDACPFKAGSTTELDWGYDFHLAVPYAAKHSIEAGVTWVSFPDADHFENRFGLNWRDMLHKYNVKDFIVGTSYINI